MTGTCPACFESHRLTACGGDPVAAADEWVANLTRPPTPAELWVAGFGRTDPNYLTDDQCWWFQYLLKRDELPAEAVAEYETFASSTVREPEPINGPASAATGQHLGAIGERRRFSVTVVRITSLGLRTNEFNNKEEERFLTVMEDAHKNMIVWYTGENLDLEVGEEIEVAARVEAHSEYQGKKQTRVSRLKRVKA